MRLDPNDLRLAKVPAQFVSFWPSNDSLLDGKVAEMLASKLGEESVLQSALASSWDALRIALKNKATIVGDFLQDQLKVVATFRESPVGEILQGVFANVEWGQVRTNPEQAVLAMAQVAVPAALTAITAVPIAGQLAAAYFSAGLKLAEMFTRPDPLLMPWAQYSRDADEDLTSKVILGGYSKEVDQTNLYRPPWNPNSAWSLGIHGDAKNPSGFVWAPWTGKDIPWAGEHVGLLPGTLRIFGQVQLTRPGERPPELNRIARAPKNVTPKDLPLFWPPTATNCGDFYPASASTCGTLWNMSGKPGSPDMFKIHVQTLLDEWKRAFESMEESFIELWNNPAPLMGQHGTIGATSLAEARRTLSDAQASWVATRITPASPWVLGAPWRVPSNWGWVVPGIYTGGKPGDPAGRTPALWIEEDTPKDPKSPAWPYGGKPRQHHCSKWKACSSDLAATISMESVQTPAAWKDPNGPAPDGYRKMPWPTPEMDAAVYASPWTAIVKPALELLRKQQEASLRATIVSAYVRPVELPGLPMYGAFKDKALQKICLDVREQLLKHPIKYRVDLKDAEAIDPQFAQRLKESGVTGGPMDYVKSFGVKTSGPVEDAEPPPPGEEPQGGIPFGGRVGRDDSRGGSGLLVGAAAAAAGFYFLRRRR